MSLRRVALGVLVAVIGAMAPRAGLASVEVSEARAGYLAFVHLRIEGEITPGDADHLPELFDRARKRTSVLAGGGQPLVMVSLNSPGGSLVAALEIGRFLRRNMAETVLEPGAECSSACVFILASGVERTSVDPSSRIGIHRPTFPQEVAVSMTFADSNAMYESLSEACRDYLRRMGMHSELMNAMLRVPSTDVRYLSEAEATNYGLFGDDAGFKEWARSKDIEAYGEDYVSSIERYLSCFAKGEGKSDCRKRAGLSENPE